MILTYTPQQAPATTTTQPPAPFPPPFDPGVPETVMILMITLACLAAATIIFYPLMRALGRRWERRGEAPQAADVRPRLDRIEQAIDAIAVEVERISEGQRYMTRQMHELRALPAPNPFAQPAQAQRSAEAVSRGEPGT
ncbi:MAG: hypothetical protein ACT4R6_01395 [Gemmatimonadaceae bacterium]